MNREMPFNPEDANFAGENSGEQKAPEQKPKELTDQEMIDRDLKKTISAFKDIAKKNPITDGVKKVKDFFGK